MMSEFVRNAVRFTGISKFLTYLRRHHAWFAKAYKAAELNLRHKDKPLVLIYTMGKVGGSSVYHSLKNMFEDKAVLHLHWLNPANLKQDERFHKKFYQDGRKIHGDKIIIPDYLLTGNYLATKLRKGKRKRPRIKIITLTRDPVSRNISSFFENLTNFFDYSVRKELETRSADDIASELCNIYKDKYIGRNGIDFLDCDPLTWFSIEPEVTSGINVFSTPFPVDKGYVTLENEYFEMLIIRLEDLSSCFDESIKLFTGLKPVQKKVKNAGQDKSYSEVYKRFRKKIIFSTEYLDMHYRSKYATHFYTEKEIIKFRANWECE